MTVPALNHRSFEREISGCPGFEQGRPENILFFSDATLERVAKGSSDEFSPESKLHALSELLFRYVLSPGRYNDSATIDLLAEWIGRDELVDFHDKCISYASGGTAQDCDSVFSSFEGVLDNRDVKAIKNAVKPYLKADGIIPVIQGGESWLLPFWFEPRHGKPCISDAAHAGLDEWSGYLSELKEITEDVVVGFRSGGAIVATGDSLMLPIQMAWWRKQNEIPHYRPLRFMATGSLHAGFLGDVDVREKGEKIALAIAGGFLVRPGVGGAVGEIAVKSDVEEVKSLVKRWAEEQTICDASYAIRHIETFDTLVRHTNSADWASVNKRLDHIFERLKKWVDPNAWLDVQMLRSAARCHAGRTADALELNRAAREFASSKVRFFDRLLRLEIENLVILLDFEDFELLMSEASGLEERIEKFSREHSGSAVGLDLKMRYCGTMGQVYAYAALRDGLDDYWSKARDCFECAFDIAGELHGRCETGSAEKCRRLGDMAQDANYLYLWSVLHDEPVVDEQRCVAEGCADALTDAAYGKAGKQSADRNNFFRQRIAAFRAYREMLRGKWSGSIPDARDAAEKAYFWVAGTTAKYLAALHAKRGEVCEAERYFESADEQMTRGRQGEDGHVLRIIHMTILAEAYRSLRQFDGEHAKVAESMRERALCMFRTDESRRWGKEAWKRWLEVGGDDASYPGLSFWY